MYSFFICWYQAHMHLFLLPILLLHGRNFYQNVLLNLPRVRHIEVVLNMSSNSLSLLSQNMRLWNINLLVDSLLMNRMCLKLHCIISDSKKKTVQLLPALSFCSFWADVKILATLQLSYWGQVRRPYRLRDRYLRSFVYTVP